MKNLDDGSTQEPLQTSTESKSPGDAGSFEFTVKNLAETGSAPAASNSGESLLLSGIQDPVTLPPGGSLSGPSKGSENIDPAGALEISQDRTIVSAAPIADAQEFYPAGSVASLAQVLVGQTLDHYQLYELVGGGGMGAVFKASDLRLDRIVAVKVIPNLGRDQESLKRFRVEAQSAAKLDHPNIARVYYVGETAAWSYIVFEFVEGVNLRDLVVRNVSLSIDDAIYYTIQIAQALQHASDRAVVHRDIKPSNALVTSGGMVKVVDMGLARTTSLDQSTNDLTASGVTLGTFDYISPEQARDPRSADVRSDLYSLGCTLYYLLVGRPPYYQGTAIQKLLMHGETPPEDPRHFRDDIPNELVTVIRKLMAKRPRDRYQTPVELIVDLQSLASDLDLPKSQAGFITPSSLSVSYSNWIRAFLPWVIGLVCISVSAMYLHQRFIESGSFEIPQDIITVPVSASVIPDSASLKSAPRSDFASRNAEATDKSKSPTEPAVGTIPSKPESFSFIKPTLDGSDLNSLISGEGSTNVSNNEARNSKAEDLISPMLSSESSSLVTDSPRRQIDSSSLSPENSNRLSPNQESLFPSLESLKMPFNFQSDILSSAAAKKDFDTKKEIIGTGTIASKSPIIVVRNKMAANAEMNAGSLGATSTVASLSEAIRLANDDASVEEIWIDEDWISITKSLTVTRTQLTLRSVPGRRARIEWKSEGNLVREISSELDSPDSNSLRSIKKQEWASFLVLQDSNLTLLDLDIDVQPSSDTREHVAAITVSPGSQIEFKNGCITLSSLNRSGTTAGVVIEGKNQSNPPQVDFEDVIVRGSGDCIRMEVGMRSELRWRNGLLAVDGRLLSANGASTVTKTPPNIRMDLQDVTVAAALGLACVRITSAEPYPVCISRDAKNCTFVTDRDSSFVTIEGLTLKESNELQQLLPTWVDLRGTDNSYDERIEILLRLEGASGEIKRIGFEAASLGFFSERAPETSIRWSQAINGNKAFDQRAPSDYLQQPSGAFRSGMDADSLPNL